MTARWWPASPFARLIAFYALVGAGVYALVRLVPSLAPILSLEVGEAPIEQQVRGAFGQPAAASLPLAAENPAWVVVTAAIVGSLLFALPVAWTYTVTKRGEGYDKSVVQMIIMLPVAVAAVVLVVFGSLSLAFALAGIVAAVRFRTTLKDVKDAVFAFVAIGIGLAAGIQSWMLAGLLSLIFSFLALVLWKFEVGEAGPAFGSPAGRLTLGEALTPGDAEPPVTVGEDRLVAPLTADELARVERHAPRLAQYVKADALRPKGKYQQLLLVHTSRPDEARPRVEQVLDEYAARWQLVDTLPWRDGSATLEYLVRLEKTAGVGELLDRLHDRDGIVRALEIKSVKGLRKRLT